MISSSRFKPEHYDKFGFDWEGPFRITRVIKPRDFARSSFFLNTWRHLVSAENFELDFLFKLRQTYVSGVPSELDINKSHKIPLELDKLMSLNACGTRQYKWVYA